jgi:hypothetical protein
MLQIIIWLGSVYLILKGFEMLQAGLLASDEQSDAKLIVYLGVVAAVLAAIIFIWLANAQVQGNPSSLNELFSSPDEMPAELGFSIPDAEEAANAAMKAANNATDAANAAIEGSN